MASVTKRLIINGSERYIICDPENDSLADVLRRLGLTGTKIGCRKGVCGACSVILNGELVRSCVRKITSVEDASEITTIEGIGTPDHLHPLQLSWIVHGGVQCGFCTPGFIVSAKALLDKNPSPSRDDVRAWFQKHRNACRCTGYKQIVDAVMDAAMVLRGEKTMEDLAWKMPEDKRILGSSIPRPTAAAMVTGTRDFGDDIGLKVPDVLHLAAVMPNAAHAVIRDIDYSEAEKAPGVYKIITARDIRGDNHIIFPLGSPRAKTDGNERKVLCDEKIYRNGDIVALVAADTKKHAEVAAKLVRVQLEALPEYDEALTAMAEGTVEIHPGVPNVFLDHPLQKGKPAKEVIERSKYSVEGSFYTTREPHLPIEPEVGQAYPDGEGGVVIQVKSHGTHLIQETIAPTLGLPVDKVRLILNPSGGSFGYALSPGFAALLGVAALATDRAVTMTMSYEQHQRFTGKRAASYSNGRLACDENGKLTASEFEIAYDKGSYSEFGGDLADAGLIFFGAPYYIPNVSAVAKCVFSNQPFSTAYRGFGSPQVYTASEQLMDMLADKAGIDPFEMRYRNVYRPGDTGNAGNLYHVYPMEGILNKLRPKYEALCADAKKNSTPEKPRGVGVSCGSFKVGDPFDHAEVALELNPDGSVTNFNSWNEIGQGADVGVLTHTYEALRPLGLRLDQVRTVTNDTKLCPNTGLAASSRSTYFHGKAVLDAAEKLMNAMRKPDGTFRSYDEMVAEGIPTKYLGVVDMADTTVPLSRVNGQGDIISDYSYSAYVAEVEVDVATGKVKVLQMHCVADVGTVSNQLTLRGQAYGGMSHCIGFALSENYTSPQKHGNMLSAGLPYIETIPDGDAFTVEFLETKRPEGPWGCGGASETFQSGGHVSILNAIYRAAGVRVYQLPASPDRIRDLLAAKAQGIDSTPKRYPIEEDLYGYLEDCRQNPKE